SESQLISAELRYSSYLSEASAPPHQNKSSVPPPCSPRTATLSSLPGTEAQTSEAPSTYCRRHRSPRPFRPGTLRCTSCRAPSAGRRNQETTPSLRDRKDQGFP